jgi:3-oxoacyl-[acyl-carrier-protein] synthase II
VVAATIAIRAGLHGVCLSLCNGADSGWSALLWAQRLIAAGRADTVLVVGVETPSVYERTLRGEAAAPLVDGAAAVVLGRSPAGSAGPAMAEAVGTRVAGPVLAGLEPAAVGGVADLVAAVHRARTGTGPLAVTPPGSVRGGSGPGTWTVGA